MPGRSTASRFHHGAAPEAVDWSELVKIFNAMYGFDVHHLDRWPKTMHSVHARWEDAAGVLHEAKALTDIERAYRGHETARIDFSGWREGGDPCWFEYYPGAVPASATARVQGAPDEVEAMISPVEHAFPYQRRVVFISWSGPESQAIADAVRSVLLERLPPRSEVFFSPLMRPGVDPLKEMFDANLLMTDAHVVIVTAQSTTSPWLTWEVASSWARGKLVVPIFVDGLGDGPLRWLAQGAKLDEDVAIRSAVREVLTAVGGEAAKSLSEAELKSIQRRQGS